MGIQQGHVTINGYVAKEPRSIGEGGRTPMCTFRLASTRAYFDSKTHSWKDLATTWISVKAYRALATNIVASLRTGDPVIVTDCWGRMSGTEKANRNPPWSSRRARWVMTWASAPACSPDHEGKAAVNATEKATDKVTAESTCELRSV